MIKCEGLQDINVYWSLLICSDTTLTCNQRNISTLLHDIQIKTEFSVVIVTSPDAFEIGDFSMNINLTNELANMTSDRVTCVQYLF